MVVGLSVAVAHGLLSGGEGFGWFSSAVFGLGALAALLVSRLRNGARMPRAWVAMAFGLVFTVAGDLASVGGQVGLLLAGSGPLGDLLYVVGYVGLACGLIGLVRPQLPDWGVGLAIDWLILSVGGYVFLWMLVMDPIGHERGAALTAASTIYPLFDIALLALLLLRIIGSAEQRHVFRLLGVAAAVVLLSDLADVGAVARGSAGSGGWIASGWDAAFVLWGAALLHPELGRTQRTGRGGNPGISVARMALLSVLCASAPVGFWIELTRGDSQDIPLLAGASTLLLALFVIRLFQTTRLLQAALLQVRRLDNAERAATVSAREAADANAKFAAFMAAVPAFAFIKDADGRYEYANPRALAAAPERFGTDWLGKTDFDLWPPAVAAEMREHDLGALSPGGPLEYTHQVPLADGTHEVLNQNFPVPNGKGGQSVGVIGIDITERVRAERERAELARAIEQSAESIVITDADANIVYVNPACERITGYAREELVGKNPRVLNSGTHDAAFFADMWAQLRSNRTWAGEIVNRRRDGTLFREAATITPMTDDGGRITSYVAVKRDVTREHALEEQLRQASRIEAVGRLAGGVAHDFNNFLTAIRGYAELARSEVSDPNAQADLDEVLATSDRASALVRQLLAFSRQAPVEARLVDVFASIEALAPMLGQLIGENVVMDVRLPPAGSGGVVRIDPSQLEQVIVNLVVNAWDAIADGGQITVDGVLADVDANIAAMHPGVEPGPFVRISVTDTGAGMDEATMARIFEPFFTTKGPGKGTGMGLATVDGVVEQAGGFIEVSSRPGRGTAFGIFLPRAHGPVRATSALTPATSSLDGQGVTILVTEDESAVRTLVGRILTGAGYHVLAASDGHDALAVLDAWADPATSGEAGAEAVPGVLTHPIGLLVSDVRMPGMDGRELARQLRSRDPGLPILFMSGFSGSPDDDHLWDGAETEGGHVAWLNKPFDGAVLLKLVRELARA